MAKAKRTASGHKARPSGAYTAFESLVVAFGIVQSCRDARTGGLSAGETAMRDEIEGLRKTARSAWKVLQDHS